MSTQWWEEFNRLRYELEDAAFNHGAAPIGQGKPYQVPKFAARAALDAHVRTLAEAGSGRVEEALRRIAALASSGVALDTYQMRTRLNEIAASVYHLLDASRTQPVQGASEEEWPDGQGDCDCGCGGDSTMHRKIMARIAASAPSNDAKEK